jgi:NAD(P)-dependent dehydrogenase (short-subunit alcohol dehydrogenase family)
LKLSSERRLVLITGAFGGIGRAAAGAFARRGDRVVAVDRDESLLESLTSEFGGPDRMVPIVADVTDAASMKTMSEHVLSDVGLPDVVIANAGIGLHAPFADTSDDDLRKLFDVNVVGVFRTVRPFLPAMIERGSGRILFVSSIVGKRGVPHYAGYSASKFALHGMADALRCELLATGVTVGVICPASTETRFREHSLHSGPQPRRVRPVRRTTESVAPAIVAMADSRRREKILGLENKLLALADTLFPGLADKILTRILTGK